ncbi:MAG: tail fiber domain-containing protein [Bacteroidota bacterium]
MKLSNHIRYNRSWNYLSIGVLLISLWGIQALQLTYNEKQSYNIEDFQPGFHSDPAHNEIFQFYQDSVFVVLDRRGTAILSETGEDGLNFQMEVLLTKRSEKDVKVTFKYSGSALFGEDYVAPLEVIIPAGEDSKLLSIRVIPDQKLEQEIEDFYVEIDQVKNAQVYPSRVRFDIEDNPILSALPSQVELRQPFGNQFLGTPSGAPLVSNTRHNTFMGDSSGIALTSGDNNTFLGFNTGQDHDRGLNGTYIGSFAGRFNTSAPDNTNIGFRAGVICTTGTDNTMIGAFAGENNRATDNTFIGTEAGRGNTSGFDNTFVGEEAGQNNTTGGNNTFIGEDAGATTTGSSSNATERYFDNTFVGTQAGFDVEGRALRNTAVGHQALYDVRDTDRNTAVGDSAGTDVGEGFKNTFVGQAAGAATDHADFNTFVGSYSGWDNNRNNNTTNANRNTYIGYYAGYSNREGQENVGGGTFADFLRTGGPFTINVNRSVFLGAGADMFGDGNDAVIVGAFSDAEDPQVIGIGFGANITQDRGIGIGYLTDVRGINAIGIGPNTNITGDFSIGIGNGTQVIPDYEAYFGNSTTVSIGGIVNWTISSDKDFKHNIQENVPGLQFIKQLRPVTYHLDLEAYRALTDGIFPANTHKARAEQEARLQTGFIAQEVEQAAEALGYEFSGVKKPSGEKDVYGLRYAEFVMPLVKAVQELHQQIKANDLEIEAKEALLAKYDRLIGELESQVARLEQMKRQDNIQVTTPIATKQDESSKQ